MSPLVDHVALKLGAERVLRRKRRHTLAIVMYHGVVEAALEPVCWHQLPLRSFEQQIAWLVRHRTVLPLAEALGRMVDGTLPDEAAAVTFDDGYRNNLTRALPILEHHGVPATVFVVTGRRGPDARLWPDRLWKAFRDTRATTLDAAPLELGSLDVRDVRARGAAYARVVHAIKEVDVARWDALIDELVRRLAPEPGGAPDDDFALLDDGELATLEAHPLVELGPHSVTHPILSRCTDEQVTEEVTASCAELAARNGAPPTVFAYPNGRAQDFDDRARRAVQQAGVRFALSTEHGLARRESDPLALPRISVGADLPFARFRLLLAGA
ncbi:MAG: polysaccharide deacetylase family protein [Planctomycetota bacterium]